MSSFCESREAWLAALLLTAAQLLASPAMASPPAFPGIGRAATAQEVAAWDIDVRPDFKGLPPGSGTVAQGMVIWEGQCASCHGVFGENNQTFAPLVGGTTAQDIATGRVARLTDAAYPGRTTLMKVATLSTLWDYIHRAMPWNAPKSLTPDQVYAVTAYLLNLGGIVPDDFTLSDRSMGQAQQRLPNRNGMSTDHGLWPGSRPGDGQDARRGHSGRPDVKALACMRDCVPEPKVASLLPDFARNAHGNLAEQNRRVGATRGAETRPAVPAPGAVLGATQGAAQAAAPIAGADAIALTRLHACMACHGLENRIVGPSFRDIALKYAERGDAVAYLAGKIRAGGVGQWGAVPMPAQALSDAEARTIAQWLATGAAK